MKAANPDLLIRLNRITESKKGTGKIYRIKFENKSGRDKINQCTFNIYFNKPFPAILAFIREIWPQSFH